MTDTKSNIRVVFICVLSFALYAALWHFRWLDDNRLTSWDLAFRHISAWSLVPTLGASMLLAYALSRRALPSTWVLGALAFLSGALFWSLPEVVVDASRYFTQAKHLSVYGPGFFLKEWGGQIGAWTDLPLVPFIHGAGFSIFGESRLVVQVITTAMFACSVVLTSIIGSKLWDAETGRTGGTLLLAMPYVYTQVPMMLVDVPAMFFLLLALYLFIKALEHPGFGAGALAALSISLAMLVKYSLWAMLSVLAVYLVIRAIETAGDAPGGKYRGLSLILFGVVVAAAGCGIVLGAAALKPEVFKAQIELLINYQGPGLRGWSESFKSTFLYQVHPFVTFGALASLYVAFKKRDLKYLVVLWLVLLAVAGGVRRIRYVMPVFPMLALMASYGLASIGHAPTRRFIVLSAVAASLVLAGFVYMPFLKSHSLMNLKLAGQYLDTLGPGDVEVHALAQESIVNPAVSVPILDLHTSAALRYKYVRETNLSEEEIRRSSLRFTWQYSNPRYYEPPEAPEAPGPTHMAVITPGVDPPAGDYQLIKKFNVSEGIYRYATFVNIYSIPQ